MSTPVVGRPPGGPTPNGAASPFAATGPGGSRLPSAPRERRPAMIALAVLLVVGGAAAAGLLALRLDDREAVLVTTRAIAPGDVISAGDLAQTRVASDGLNLVPAERADSLIGLYAVGPIPQGRLLDFEAPLSQEDLLGDGDAEVGVALGPGRLPADGLQPGDRVQIVETRDGAGPGGEPWLLLGEGTVSAVAAASEDGLGVSVDTAVLTISVAPDLAPRVAAASATGVLALTRVGTAESDTVE